MIVYVESNFVLEIAFLQEDSQSCETLLALANTKVIALVLPTVSVSEPYETLVRRRKQRQELHNRLAAEVGQLSRSQPYAQPARELRDAMALLTRSLDEEKQRLDGTLVRILEIVEVIPVTAATLHTAITVQQGASLSPQDALVYASILQHLATAPSIRKCFVTTNSKDFFDPDIRQRLRGNDCQLLTRFSDALGYVRQAR